MAQLTPLQAAIAARFLRNMSEDLSNNSCNDFFLDNTPENLAFARAVYDGDEPHLVSGGTRIYLADWLVADYLARLLERD
jgi:hypothetical protein